MKEKKFSNATYKDIVVLLRSAKDKASILEKVFKEKGIPAFCDVSSSLLESDEVRFVISFLKVLDNPLQDIHLASIMYSIIGNFSLDELVEIRTNKDKNYYYNILEKKEYLESLSDITDSQKTLLEKIQNLLNLLSKFNDYKYIFNISELITRIYKETNIYYEFSMEENSNIRKANLNMLIDFAIKFEKNESKNLSAYIEYIDNMKNKSDSLSSAKMIGENEDVVRIMTIHKSKGLEFPIVILSDSNKKYNFKDKSSMIIMHHKLGLGINILNKSLGVSYPSVIKKSIVNAIDSETRSEELRMLYVALTRAKEKLIIFSAVKDYQKFKEKELVLFEDNKIDPYLISKNNSYFENIHMCLDEESKKLFNINVIKLEDLVKNDEIVENIDIKTKIKNKIKNQSVDNTEVGRKLDYKYQFISHTKAEKRISVTSLKESNIESKKIDNIKEKYSIDDLLGNNLMSSTKKGTLMHFIIENLDFNIETLKDLKDYSEKLVLNGIITREDIRNINVNSLLKFLSSNLAEKVRKSNYVRQEEEFILKDDELSISQIQGIIDLYFINENSNIELVDFKTDKLNEESEFIKNYKIQIDTYARALEKITGKIVEKRYIYSFNLNKAIEL